MIFPFVVTIVYTNYKIQCKLVFMKEYEIFSKDDFNSMVCKFEQYFDNCKVLNIPFPKLKITAKKWRKSKSPRQHKKYWSMISEMQRALELCGTELTIEQCHELVKFKAGFVRCIIIEDKEVFVTKSIADISEDVDSAQINDLIEFIYRFCSEKLNYVIEEF